VAAHCSNFSRSDLSPVQKLSMYTVGAHGPPFVMIAMEPNFCDIIENPVFGNILWREVTMIIDDGHISRIIVEQTSLLLVS